MSSMQVVVQPRLQVERFSLYWKESLQTETKVLPALELQSVEGSATVQALLAQAAVRLGWEPVEQLQRLEGFKDPWERAIVNGRELQLGQTLEQALQAQPGPGGKAVVTFVRKVLKADGWKIRLPDDFMTDSDDSSDDE